MGRISSRVAAAERRLGAVRDGYCRHLPPVVEYQNGRGEVIPDPHGEPVSEYAREMAGRRKAQEVGADAVCWCGRERLKIVLQYVETPPPNWDAG